MHRLGPPDAAGVYVIDDPSPNAFATGVSPDKAAITYTTGLLAIMNREELEGVTSHEMSHIKNHDILVSTLAVTMVGIVALIADLAHPLPVVGRRPGVSATTTTTAAGPRRSWRLVGFVLLPLFAPIIAQLMQFAVSRNREGLADPSGVEMTRYPPGLHLGAREAARRPDRGALRQPGHRPPLDRVAHRP